MKSKISIWDCRRAIEIAGGLPLTIRGDLFAKPGPHPVARWISETVHVTQLEVKQGRWVIGNIGFTWNVIVTVNCSASPQTRRILMAPPAEPAGALYLGPEQPRTAAADGSLRYIILSTPRLL